VDLVKRRPLLYVVALDVILWAIIAGGVILIWRQL
jgi:hypothetical protein